VNFFLNPFRTFTPPSPFPGRARPARDVEWGPNASRSTRSDLSAVEVEIQKIEKESECFDIEKREGCGCAKFQSPLEVEVLAMERMEKKGSTLAARGEVSGNL
jgi:hypothetical protein